MDHHNNEFSESIDQWVREHGDDFHPKVTLDWDAMQDSINAEPQNYTCGFDDEDGPAGFFEVRNAYETKELPDHSSGHVHRPSTPLETAIGEMGRGDCFRVPEYQLDRARQIVDTVNALGLLYLEVVVAPVGHEVWHFVVSH